MRVVWPGLAALLFTWSSLILVPATVHEFGGGGDPEGALFLLILATPSTLAAFASWAWLFEAARRAGPGAPPALRRLLWTGGASSMAALLTLSWGLAIYGFWLCWVDTAWRVGLMIVIPALGLVMFEGWVFSRLYPISRRDGRLHRTVAAIGGVLVLAGMIAMGLALRINHQVQTTFPASPSPAQLALGWRIFEAYLVGGMVLGAGCATLAARRRPAATR